MVWKVNESLNKNNNEKKQINILSVLNQQNDVVLKNKDTSNEFNNLFTANGEKITNNNNKGNKTNYHKYRCFKNNRNTMFFKFITKEEIKKYILKYKESTSFYRNRLLN